MGVGGKLLELAKPLWFLVVAGATIAVGSGQADPYVPSSVLPEGPAFVFGGAALVLVAGWLLLSVLEGFLKRRAWMRAGRDAGLAPEGMGLFGRPDLTGTVEGRPVRARTVARKRKAGREKGARMRTFTIVETELDRATDQGLLVVPADGTSIRSGSMRLSLEGAELGSRGLAVVEDGGYTIVGAEEPLASEVASGRVGSSLHALGDGTSIYAGNASDLLVEILPDADASGVGGWFQGAMVDRAGEALRERVPGDASKVSAETTGLVEDGDALRRQAEAVAAVAEAFDEALGEA